MADFSGFYKKTRSQRIETLARIRQLTDESQQILSNDRNLSEAVAGKMTENHLGTFALPFSLVPEFTVNGETYSIPMVTEEPSVVAACSFGAGLIGRAGGMTARVDNRLMIGQVALYNVPDREKASQRILAEKDAILALANQAHPSIVKRGGGARHLHVETKGEFLIVYLHVDVKEAMGANILNTMLEGIQERVESLSQGQGLLAILSNYATDSLVQAHCRLPIGTARLSETVAEKIARASQLAQIDPYRAATHNKGIFNGIDAVALATGNDWRAIEAGAHAYASRSGQYRGLSIWELQDYHLVGQLTLPMPVATVGGSIGLNPKVQAAFDILGHPDARTLSEIIVSVGLCQNFAALRALVTSGIQQGHMKLQAKSLALLAGATTDEVDRVAQQLRQAGQHTDLATAKRMVQQLRQNKKRKRAR